MLERLGVPAGHARCVGDHFDEMPLDGTSLVTVSKVRYPTSGLLIKVESVGMSVMMLCQVTGSDGVTHRTWVVWRPREMVRQSIGALRLSRALRLHGVAHRCVQPAAHFGIQLVVDCLAY